jgi:hypothetical protein
VFEMENCCRAEFLDYLEFQTFPKEFYLVALVIQK